MRAVYFSHNIYAFFVSKSYLVVLYGSLPRFLSSFLFLKKRSSLIIVQSAFGGFHMAPLRSVSHSLRHTDINICCVDFITSSVLD